MHGFYLINTFRKWLSNWQTQFNSKYSTKQLLIMLIMKYYIIIGSEPNEKLKKTKSTKEKRKVKCLCWEGDQIFEGHYLIGWINTILNPVNNIKESLDWLKWSGAKHDDEGNRWWKQESKKRKNTSRFIIMSYSYLYFMLLVFFTLFYSKKIKK